MLKKYLMETFEISPLEEINCRINNSKLTVAQLIEVLKKKGTEQKIINIIENFKFSSKLDVIMYLTGIADSFKLEQVI
ncbi:hypothetical protein LGK95_10165 [Clostridium algoriphilum]|uniref:hypothetical protein n=1 Tax=Clostridium algoriphilum TaxID=198347 RepID=UPI001CF15BB6|nr:hypothetical protein [Clostridium algoriphilum]MCB2293885.1 hypothetical protein [Clostridium algoriphilum]